MGVIKKQNFISLHVTRVKQSARTVAIPFLTTKSLSVTTLAGSEKRLNWARRLLQETEISHYWTCPFQSPGANVLTQVLMRHHRDMLLWQPAEPEAWSLEPGAERSLFNYSKQHLLNGWDVAGSDTVVHRILITGLFHLSTETSQEHLRLL